MGRKQDAAALRSTWMVMREPQKVYPSRKQRRANLSVALAEARRARRKAEADAIAGVVTMPEQEAAQVPMQE